MPDNKVIKGTTSEDRLLQKLISAKNTLDKLLEESDRVFITGHKFPDPDMDCIGAAIGMSLICKKNKKKSYIVVDEPIEKNAREFIEETKGEFEYISSSKVPELLTDNSLLISLDNSQVSRTAVATDLGRFKSIFVLDHHEEGKESIETPYKCIDSELSSTCEAVSILTFLSKVRIGPKNANYLYAGIKLDTKDFTKNISTALTHNVAYKLQLKGANLKYINRWFKKNPEEDKLIQEVIRNTVVYPYQYAISCVDGLSSVNIAKAADLIASYDYSAVFVISQISEDEVIISARGNGDVDVGKIMSCFELVPGCHGGGKQIEAGAQIKGRTINEVSTFLWQLLQPCYMITEMNKEEEPDDRQLKLVPLGQNKTTD